MPRVVSLWFPTLPTDRLRRNRSAPSEGALVTAIAEQGRRVVAACSAEAQAAGVRPGQPLAEARVRHEGLIVAEAERVADTALLDRLSWHVARRWTPLVAVDGIDGLLLDVTASAHLFGGEAALLRRIAATVRRVGLAVRGAVAGSAGAAWALAHHARAPLTRVPPGDDAAAIARLPPAALRLDPVTVDALARLGFVTIAALLAVSRAPLIRRFGQGLGVRIAQALGQQGEPIAPCLPPDRPQATRHLLEPIATAEAIAEVIKDLATDLSPILEERRLGVRQAVLLCRRVDAQDVPVTIGLARPTRDPAHLADLLVRRIDTIDPGFGIEAMTLMASRTQRLAPEQIGHALRRASAGAESPDLAALVDRLLNRFGGRSLYRAMPAESDMPTRSVARIAPLAPTTTQSWRPDWPRPPRLLGRAETALVTALLPDHAPRVFTWRGRRHRVVAADGPERLHGEWWRGGEPYRTRDYFQVEVEEGGRYWLFRRGDGENPETGPGDWFVHGAFA